MGRHAIITPMSVRNQSANHHDHGLHTAHGPVSLEAFVELAQSRRSIRRYVSTPVADELVEMLLKAAIWAPSAHNRQPWRFCVVKSAGVKHALSEAMAEAWRCDLAQDGVEHAAIERRIAISRTRVTGAPVLIVPCVTVEEMDSYPDAARNRAEWMMAAQSVALACQNLLLAAHAARLGACWMCAPLFIPALVRRVLELPDAWEPQALLTLGYPAEEKQKERVPLYERVVWR